MKIAILDTKNYTHVEQFKKIKEEYLEVQQEIMKINVDDSKLAEEVLDLITACRTWLSMLDIGNANETYCKKMQDRHDEGKIKIKKWVEVD